MPENFNDYARRKTARANVETPGVITLQENLDPRLKQLNHPLIRKVWNGPFYYLENTYSDRPTTNLVFIEDKNGNTGSDEPWTMGGGETDFMIYEGLSRVYVDAVMAGAETIKGIALSVWHPDLVNYRVNTLKKRRHPTTVVTTRSGNLDFEEVTFNHPELEVVILTTDEGKSKMAPKIGDRKWVHLESTGEESDLVRGLQVLKENYQINQMSVIGSRTLATQMLDLGLIDELILTKTPIEAAPTNTPFYLGDRQKLERRLELIVSKGGVGPEEGVIFNHYLIVPKAGIEPA